MKLVNRRAFVSSLAAGGLLQLESSGQPRWTPITAKVREGTFQVNTDGTEVPLSLRQGYFYRTADGSDIKYTQRVVNGTPQGPGRGFLRDSATHASYDLYYGAKKALREKWNQPIRNRLPEPQPRPCGASLGPPEESNAWQM